jgi:hypothetical protein
VIEGNEDNELPDASESGEYQEKNDLEAELGELEERIEAILLTVKASSVEEFSDSMLYTKAM